MGSRVAVVAGVFWLSVVTKLMLVLTRKMVVWRIERSDHITKLPDELLCSILSRLTLIEAARTSVLARRWKTLWYHFRGALEFDETKITRDSLDDDVFEPDTQAVHDHLSSNMQVLQSLQSPFFDAFKVRCYNTDDFCESYLDFCVQFAMKKRMKTFELGTSLEGIVLTTCRDYKPPLEFCAWITKPRGLDDNISSLTSISLKGVTVNDDLIHHMLVNIPLLESLRVANSSELLNPKVIGATLKLKYLEIWGKLMKSIEICAPNLLAFTVNGMNVKLLMKNAPKLIELSIPVPILQTSPKSVSSYLPRIEKLTWEFIKNRDEHDLSSMHPFVEHNKLQHLTWKLGHYNDKYLIQLNSLLEASPSLQKFTLVNVFNPQMFRNLVSTVTAKYPHKCLKVLEIYGFTGAVAEVKLVKYFLANTTSLKEIILDTISPYRRELRRYNPDLITRSKSRALELMEYLPPKVSLVILE